MKILIFTLCILGLLGLFYAGYWQDQYWSSHNPNIFHFIVVEVWNTAALHPTLDSLGLDSINTSDIPDETVKISVQDVNLAKSKAVFSKLRCEALYSKVVGEMPAYAIGSGVFGPVLSTIFGLMAIEIKEKSFSECGDYGTYWRETMDGAENILVMSNKQYQSGFTAAQSTFASAKDAGICDDDFTGAAKEECKEAELLMNDLVSGSNNKINNFVDVFKAEGLKYVPDMTGYANITNIIWLDGIPKAEQVKNLSETSMKKAEEGYSKLMFATEAKIGSEKQRMKDLENERITLITDAKYSSDSSGTITKRYEEMIILDKSGNSHYANAFFAYSSKYPDYLKNSINEMKLAYAQYEKAETEAKSILDDAKNISDMQKAEAEAEIKDFEKKLGAAVPGSSAKALYESAQENLQNGDSAKRVGDKFDFYLQAAADARMAKTKQGQTSAELESTVEAEFKRTSEIISNAKKDGIDTYFEESELKLMKGTISDWMENELVKLQDAVLDKVRIKYVYLEGKRTELLGKISLGSGKLDDLKTDMAKAEAGVMENGKIDFETGVGKLSGLAKQYQYVEGVIEKEMKTIATNGLKKYVSYEFDEIGLDTPVNISTLVFLHNPYNFEAKGVQISIPIAIDLKENEITDGAEFVDSTVYVDGKLILQLKRIDAYGNQKIKFIKQAIIASMLERKISTTGNPDGTADSEEKITLNAEYDVSGVHVPEYFTSWTIDGKDGSGRKTGKLTKGTHVLIGKYKTENAFEFSQADYRAIGVGLNNEVSYDLLVVPKMNIDSASLVLSEDDNGISGFTVTAYSGSVSVKNKKSLGNGMYAFELAGLEKDVNITLRVGYTISNSAAYVASQLSMLKDDANSIATKAFLMNAEAALAGNDTRSAVENVEKAKHEVEKEADAAIFEQNKLGRAKDALEIKKKEVESALESAGKASLVSPFIAKLETRKSMLDDALAVKTSAELADFDQTWEKKQAIVVRKEASEKYNLLKEEYLSINGGISNESAFEQFETAMSRLEMTNSIDDAVVVENQLQEVEKFVQKNGKISAEEYDIVVTGASVLKDGVEKVIGRYAKEYDAAKGSQLSSLFSYDYKNAQKDIKALDNLVAKKASASVILEKNDDVKKAKSTMQDVLDYIEKESNRKIGDLKALYASKKGTLDENERKLAEQGLLKMEEQINQENYAEALKTGDALVKIIGKIKSEDNVSLIVLGATALLIIGAIILYLTGRKGERRIPRKLRSVER